MHIVKTQTDKIIVGTNDVSYVAPDTSPTGTAVLNGPVLIGDVQKNSDDKGVLSVSSNTAQQNPLDTQPAMEKSLAVRTRGNVDIRGDGKTANALRISGGSSVDTVHISG
tara:strand:- start:567 stop:896 length:330 start_codon:yes stop_codon:yes gene_type:complete